MAAGPQPTETEVQAYLATMGGQAVTREAMTLQLDGGLDDKITSSTEVASAIAELRSNLAKAQARTTAVEPGTTAVKSHTTEKES